MLRGLEIGVRCMPFVHITRFYEMLCIARLRIYTTVLRQSGGLRSGKLLKIGYLESGNRGLKKGVVKVARPRTTNTRECPPCFCTRKTLHRDSKGIIDILDPQIAGEMYFQSSLLRLKINMPEISKSVTALALSNTAALTVTRKFL